MVGRARASHFPAISNSAASAVSKSNFDVLGFLTDLLVRTFRYLKMLFSICRRTWSLVLVNVTNELPRYTCRLSQSDGFVLK